MNPSISPLRPTPPYSAAEVEAMRCDYCRTNGLKCLVGLSSTETTARWNPATGHWEDPKPDPQQDQIDMLTRRLAEVTKERDALSEKEDAAIDALNEVMKIIVPWVDELEERRD